jgi:hypothetical protein
MLNPKVREELEKQVQPILERFLSRSKQVGETRIRSAMGPLLEMLRDGRAPSDIDFSRANVKSDLELWIMQVGVALHYIGEVSAHVVVARLTRRTKSAERSWEQLERELFILAPQWGKEIPSIPDMKQQFTWGLPILAHVLDDFRNTT